MGGIARDDGRVDAGRADVVLASMDERLTTSERDAVVVRQSGSRVRQAVASKAVEARMSKLQAKSERCEVQRWKPKLGRPGVMDIQ